MPDLSEKAKKLYDKMQEQYEKLSEDIYILKDKISSSNENQEVIEQQKSLMFKQGQLNQFETIKYTVELVELMTKKQQNENALYIKNNIREFYSDEKNEIVKKIKLLESANSNFNNTDILEKKIMYLKGRLSAINDSLVMTDKFLNHDIAKEKSKSILNR
jgi:hypothetical protein